MKKAEFSKIKNNALWKKIKLFRC